MKILLTLFVLLFSSSVVAGDDLEGNNLLCLNDPDKGKIWGLEFLPNKEVCHLWTTGETKFEWCYYRYETSPFEIEIIHRDNENIPYIINRKNLNIMNRGKLMIKGELCEVINTNKFKVYFRNTHKKIIKEIKSKNKL